MTFNLKETGPDPIADRYWQDLESALMAQAIVSTADVSPERRKALVRVWIMGTFDAAAAGLEKGFTGCGLLQWAEQGTIRHLMYHAPYGLTCHLGRAYRQPDGSWAALVVAGVGMDEYEAMAKAEWAVSRLCAE